MQKQLDKKEWFNKNDILEIYPIGITTYKSRIKRLSSPQYSRYTRFNSLKLENSNLDAIPIREIHRDILNELFGDTRRPNLSDTSKVVKWVNNCRWHWFGDIVPSKTLPNELKGKMKYLFKSLKNDGGKENNLVMFYSIEPNTDDSFFHCHFLIRDDLGVLKEKEITNRLELVCEPNTSTETRIYLKKYDYYNFGKRGSDYTLKRLEYGFEIMK
jgi:hypothetical protein